MEFAVFIVLIPLAIVVATILSKVKNNKIIEARIYSTFGKIPEAVSVEFESIRQYTKYIKYDDFYIDNITWNDLEMDKVFERLNCCLSSVGEEYLYNALHFPKSDQVSLIERERLINFFDKYPNERFAVQFALAKLGKQNYNGLPNLIFNSKSRLLSNTNIYRFLAILPLISIVGFAFNSYVGVGVIILSFIINLIVYICTMKLISIESQTIRYFSSLIKCTKKLLTIKQLNDYSIVNELSKPYNIFKGAVNRAPTSPPSIATNIIDIVWMYISIIFLVDIRNYNNLITVITNKNDIFHTLYKTIGEIDLALSVLSYRKSLRFFTIPKFHQINAVNFEDIFHPLVENPVTNTYHIKNDCLITGSNASGKSTFIKALAINGILSQTIFTCTAKKFVTRLSLVVTSMALRDNVQNKESYFIVEIKSLKRVLDLVKKHPCICYVDEILRGTNTIERIASSASFLSYLHRQDCLCIAASHDIELTHILSNQYDNFNFCEQIQDGKILFDYKLKQGSSTTRNAIKLLDLIGFEKEIIQMAEKIANSHLKLS